MKKSKRCIVVAQGFYEWLKKNGGKEKIPHYTKRKDGQLMCFAGLWDCVQYEGMPFPLKSPDVCSNCERLRGETLHVYDHHHRLQQAAFVSARPDASDLRERLGSNSPLA
jgi:putative SOS response-associated peptidase YedK